MSIVRSFQPFFSQDICTADYAQQICDWYSMVNDYRCDCFYAKKRFWMEIEVDQTMRSWDIDMEFHHLMNPCATIDIDGEELMVENVCEYK